MNYNYRVCLHKFLYYLLLTNKAGQSTNYNVVHKRFCLVSRKLLEVYYMYHVLHVLITITVYQHFSYSSSLYKENPDCDILLILR